MKKGEASFVAKLNRHTRCKFLPEAEDTHVDNVLKVSWTLVVGVATVLAGHAPFSRPVVAEETKRFLAVRRRSGERLTLPVK